jgi:glucose/arabinose dehydrogenase
MNSHFGKIVRIAPDGSVPQDNPFVGQQGARAEIWSVGHRNVQAAAFDPQGRLWEIEHGTRGGDELNLVAKGKNYGWPLQAYGIEYNGSPIPNSSTTREGMEQPVYYWDPVIAPSGAQWYTGSAFPAWRGSLFIGGLNSTRLVRLELEGDRVKGEEHLLVDRAKRIRDVKQGPNGHLYVITDYDNGELWRISPR